MEIKHTPGPWEIDGEYVQQSGHPDVGICDVLNMDRGGNTGWFRGPTTEANGRLIAAAPDLLAELRMAHQIIRNALAIMTPEQKAEWAQVNERDDCIGEGTTRANERLAIIAKAAGEQV
jgi:hypothetical protein